MSGKRRSLLGVNGEKPKLLTRIFECRDHGCVPPRYSLLRFHSSLRLTLSRLAGLLLASVPLLCATTSRATSIGLGQASQYTVFSLSGTYQNNSNVAITGNVAVGPQGKLSVAAPSSVNGTLFRDPSATVSGTNNVLGGVQVMNLTQAVNDAINASNAFAALAPTQVLASIKSAISFTGNGADNVISLKGDINLGGKNNITLSGGTNDYFIFNIAGGMTLGGSASIVLAGGVTANHVLFNFIGAGKELTSKVGNVIQGTVLAIDRDITFHGAFGEIIGGGDKLTLMSGAQVTGMPFTPSLPRPVPEGGPDFWFSALVLLLLATFATTRPKLA